MQNVTHDNGKSPNSLNSIVSCTEEHQMKQKLKTFRHIFSIQISVRTCGYFQNNFILVLLCRHWMQWWGKKSIKAGIKSSNVCDIFMRINSFADKKTTLRCTWTAGFFPQKRIGKLKKPNGFTQHNCATVWFEGSNNDSNLFPFHVCVHYSKSDNYCIDNYR